MALSTVLLAQCSAAGSRPIQVVNACDKVRMAEYSKSFERKLAAEMRRLPPEAQTVIIDAGETRADLRACRSVVR